MCLGVGFEVSKVITLILNLGRNQGSDWVTWQNITSPRRQTRRHVPEGVPRGGKTQPGCYTTIPGVPNRMGEVSRAPVFIFCMF